MKKSISVIFILVAFIVTVGIFSGFAKSKAFADGEGIISNSKAAYLIDTDSNSVVYSKNETQRLPIASMCKIMTLLLIFEQVDNGDINLDESICVSENAAGMGGSQVFLERNNNYVTSDLIKSIVVASANDACVAMAERCCGSEEEFVQKMNEKAKELNMDNTNFVNCTGLPKPGQYSCAKDVATMFSELLKHKDYFKFSRIWTDKINHGNDRVTEISNTNKLVRFYQGCDGGKTGYTTEAGHCLAASACRNGMRLISVVISSPDSKTRFKEVSSMFNYGFANYVNKKVIDSETPLDVIVNVSGGKKDTLSVVAENSFSLFSKKNEKRSVEVNFEPNGKLSAPIIKGEIIGKLSIYENGKEIANIKVLANEDIECKTYFDRIKDVTDNWAIV